MKREDAMETILENDNSALWLVMDFSLHSADDFWSDENIKRLADAFLYYSTAYDYDNISIFVLHAAVLYCHLLDREKFNSVMKLSFKYNCDLSVPERAFLMTLYGTLNRSIAIK